MDCIVSSHFCLELLLKGKHDAFEGFFRSFPPHKKHRLFTAPLPANIHVEMEHLPGRAAPPVRWLPFLLKRERFTSKKKKSKKWAILQALCAWGYFGGGMRTSRPGDSSRRRPLCWSTPCQFPGPGPAAYASSSRAGSRSRASSLPALDAYISFTKHYFYGVHIKRTHDVHHRRAGSTSQPAPAGTGWERAVYCCVPSPRRSPCTCVGG